MIIMSARNEGASGISILSGLGLGLEGVRVRGLGFLEEISIKIEHWRVQQQ
jgi:hypothetical protein